MSKDPIVRIETLIRRFRWRLKLQRATRYLVLSLAVSTSIVALALLLVKFRMLPFATVWASAGTGLVLVILAVLTGLAWRINDVLAAAQLDEAGELHSRLSNATAFQRETNPTPMMRLAIADALSVVDKANPAKAAPWTWPPRLAFLCLAFVLLGSSVLTDIPVPTMEGQRPAPLVLAQPAIKPMTTLRKEDKKRLKQELEELERQEAKTGDPKLKSWIAKLNQLIRDLAAGKITPKEAFARLAGLQKAKEKWKKEVTRGLEKVTQKIKQAARAKKKTHKALKDLKNALKDARLKAAAKAFENLANKMKKGDLTRKDKRRIGKDLKKIAQALKSERKRQMERLKKERRRLKRKEKKLKTRLSKRDRRRLKRNQRQLDRLSRQAAQRSQAERTLDRLQRHMDQAAEDLMRRLAKQQDNKMSRKQMKQAAEMLKRLAKQEQGQRTMRIAEGKLVDMKEMMRRAGKEGKGGKGGKGSKLDRFFVKAGGKKGPGGKSPGGKDMALLKKGGKGGGMLLLKKNGAGGKPMGGKNGGQGKQPGEGIGKGHNPNVLGKSSRLKAKHREDFVSGRKGKGESKSKVVFASAKKGFASRAYRKVHQDYRGVVEKTMHRQKIPAGKRRYVRRYFDLIRPR
jgi:hypothetical protein